MIKLKPRLNMASEMVRTGSRIADIGTDHAYLPVVLIMNKKIPHAIAADLRKGPLENARQTVEANSVEEKIELRLSDGLEKILPNEVDDIVIAGMGGILISEILSKAEWIKNKSIKLILQPQSHSENLRKFLFDNGFEIMQETACFEDDKVYICMSASFCGKVCEYSEAQLVFGSFLSKNDEPSKAFVEKKLRRIKARLDALTAQGVQSDEVARLQKTVAEAELCRQ